MCARNISEFSRRTFVTALALGMLPAVARAGNPFDLFSREGRVRLAADGGAYGRYARTLLARLPAGVRIRSDLERILDRLASRARADAGLPPLKPSNIARLAARAQAVDMLLGGYVGHHSPSGFTFPRRFEAVAGPDHGNHGENAARDRQRGPVDAMKAARLFRQWLESSAHRANLMRRSWRFVSTGAVARGHHLYAVQIYWEK